MTGKPESDSAREVGFREAVVSSSRMTDRTATNLFHDFPERFWHATAECLPVVRFSQCSK